MEPLTSETMVLWPHDAGSWEKSQESGWLIIRAWLVTRAFACLQSFRGEAGRNPIDRTQ